jgi:hypothetical protein
VHDDFFDFSNQTNGLLQTPSQDVVSDALWRINANDFALQMQSDNQSNLGPVTQALLPSLSSRWSSVAPSSSILPRHVTARQQHALSPYDIISPPENLFATTLPPAANLDDTETAEATGSSHLATSVTIGNCVFPGCAVPFQYMGDHLQEAHPCPDCGKRATSLPELNNHAGNTLHRVFVCSRDGCGKAFSRSDSLRRHDDKHVAQAQRFSCPHCKKYDGDSGFIRYDHLKQHIQGYHHIDEDITEFNNFGSCPHASCEAHRDGAFGSTGFKNLHFDSKRHAFTTRAQFQKHMRKVHQESAYQCLALGCERRGGKGYFRLRDLRKHQRKEHPDTFVTLERKAEDWNATIPNYFSRYLRLS